MSIVRAWPVIRFSVGAPLADAVIEKGPVMRLWAAVLIQACRDVLCPSANSIAVRGAVQRDAVAWVGSDDSTFIEVCEVLGFDHRHVRASIREISKNENLSGGKRVYFGLKLLEDTNG